MDKEEFVNDIEREGGKRGLFKDKVVEIIFLLYLKDTPLLYYINIRATWRNNTNPNPNATPPPSNRSKSLPETPTKQRSKPTSQNSTLNSIKMYHPLLTLMYPATLPGYPNAEYNPTTLSTWASNPCPMLSRLAISWVYRWMWQKAQLKRIRIRWGIMMRDTREGLSRKRGVSRERRSISRWEMMRVVILWGKIKMIIYLVRKENHIEKQGSIGKQFHRCRSGNARLSWRRESFPSSTNSTKKSNANDN